MSAAVPLLQVRDLFAGYGEADVLQGLCLEVRAGEIVTVVGPNGAGKSTLMKTLFGLLRPRRGQILLDGRSLAGVRPADLVPLGLAYVPQEKNVFPSLTVGENLEMGAFSSASPPRRAMERVLAVLPLLGDLRDKRAGDLSGGERQMVALGRALMVAPRLLLLDEPSAGLAPRLVEEVFGHILSIHGGGVAVMMVEQNVKKALALSHRGYVLAMGMNALSDSGPALLENDEVGRLYLGL